MMLFNPAYPPTTNSLNRFKIWEQSGFPENKLGTGGYRLISSAALLDAIHEQASELGINTQQSDQVLQQHYFELLENNHPTALQIAIQMGQYLGYMLLALHHGSPVNREKNSEKDNAYWDYWAELNTIYLAGGLASGKIGALIVREAQFIVAKELSNYKIILAEHPRHLGILGAARYVTSGEQAIIFDFGGTFVKRARAFYSQNTLQRIQFLESVPSGFGVQGDETMAQTIFESFVEVIVEAYQDGDTDFIPLSIAAYVAPDGQPYLAQGGVYMLMSHLGNVPQLLSQAVSQRLGKTITVHLIHDGTAAASFYSPLENAAVITLGTAIGSGYPVARDNLCEVAPDLIVN